MGVYSNLDLVFVRFGNPHTLLSVSKSQHLLLLGECPACRNPFRLHNFFYVCVIAGIPATYSHAQLYCKLYDLVTHDVL